MKRGIVVAALVTLGAIPVFAADENESGLYLGAGAGQFNAKIDDVDELTDTVESFDDEDTSWKIFGGWRFARFFAVELDYIDLGKAEDTIGNINVATELDGFAPYLIGTLPLGPVELFARAGYYFYDVKINGESLGSLDESNEDFTYGGGVGITLFEHLHARLEYELIEISEISDSDALWLSGAWRF